MKMYTLGAVHKLCNPQVGYFVFFVHQEMVTSVLQKGSGSFLKVRAGRNDTKRRYMTFLKSINLGYIWLRELGTSCFDQNKWLHNCRQLLIQIYIFIQYKSTLYIREKEKNYLGKNVGKYM